MKKQTVLHNPHFDSQPFVWQAGPVGIVLAHGLTATPAEVRFLAERLHRQGYTIAAPLLPGHATSPEDLNKSKWAAWVRVVEETYQQLSTQCQHVFVGGESTGAVIALYLAAKYPEIAGVLAYSPAIKLALSQLDTLKLYVAAPFISALPKDEIDVAEKWQGYPVNPLRSGIQLLRLQKVVRRRLKDITQPVLVIQGRLDTTIHPQSGQIICDEISSEQKEVIWLEKSSHVVLLDVELDSVETETLNFINKCLKAKSKNS